MTTATRQQSSSRVATERGRIVWHEHLTTDVNKASNFYGKLLNWTTRKFGESYHILSSGGRDLAGLMDLPQEARRMGTPTHWLMYVGVDNVDTTHKQALELGAKSLVSPQNIPDVGRYSVIADPQFAAFAIFTPSPRSPEGSGEAGEEVFSWHELVCTDYKKELEFYGRLFGWEKRETHDMGPTGIYQVFGRPGKPEPIGGMFNRPKEMPRNTWTCYISVPDLDKAAREIPKLGGRVVNGPMEVPGGDRIVVAADTQDGMFALSWVKPK